MIGERIKQLREWKGLSRRDLEKLTSIPEYTWRAVETEKQQANESHIDSISKIWPEHKMWLVFGETYPEIGQTSPELEETRQKLDQAG